MSNFRVCSAFHLFEEKLVDFEFLRDRHQIGVILVCLRSYRTDMTSTFYFIYLLINFYLLDAYLHFLKIISICIH